MILVYPASPVLFTLKTNEKRASNIEKKTVQIPQPTTGTSSKSFPELELIDRVTHVMDELFHIPGTRFRFGLDPLLGLFPWLGDLVGAMVSGLTVLTIVRHGVSGKVVLLMGGNVLLDAMLGSIPVIGDLFDFTYKTNSRNRNLLRKHLVEGKYSGSGQGIIIGALVVLAVVLGLIGYGVWRLLMYLVNIYN